jgi:hypothetical protein
MAERIVKYGPPPEQVFIETGVRQRVLVNPPQTDAVTAMS